MGKNLSKAVVPNLFFGVVTQMEPITPTVIWLEGFHFNAISNHLIGLFHPPLPLMRVNLPSKWFDLPPGVIYPKIGKHDLNGHFLKNNFSMDSLIFSDVAKSGRL